MNDCPVPLPGEAPQILLLDDDPIVCAGVGALLSRSGYEVHSFGCGREALAFLDHHRVDLVITDILMPQFDGLELITALNKRAPRPVVFAMSGADHDHGQVYLKTAQHFGVSFIFTKPFEPRELIGEIARAIGPGRFAPSPVISGR